MGPSTRAFRLSVRVHVEEDSQTKPVIRFEPGAIGPIEKSLDVRASQLSILGKAELGIEVGNQAPECAAVRADDNPLSYMSVNDVLYSGYHPIANCGKFLVF